MGKSRLSRRTFVRAGVSAVATSAVDGSGFLGTERAPGQSGSAANNGATGVTEPVEDYQVIQRDSDETGACLIKVQGKMAAARRVKISDEAGNIWMDQESVPREFKPGENAVLVRNIPVGGPYLVEVLPSGNAKKPGDGIIFRNILVGDIWILAGQSNMFWIALAEEEFPTLPYLNMLNNMMFRSDSHWRAGIPPIFRPPNQSDVQIQQMLAVKAPTGGLGPSYYFARELFEMDSNVPIGVIPCAMGAALAEWDPAKRGQNRYGFLYQQVIRAGGRVKGMLWYQGEQDAIYGDEHETVTMPCLVYPLSTYAAEYRKLVEALRNDFHNRELVVITAQLCRHHQGKKERYKYWEEIRETQRLIPNQIPNVHVVPAVDLDVWDGLHLDYRSQKRVGRRMAYLALPYVKKGIAPRSEIKLKSVTSGTTPKSTIIVDFEGATGRLRAPGRPTGFQLRSKATGEDLDNIFKVDFDPDKPSTAILRVSGIEKKDVVLMYAPGAIPYVNITDENDMAVPAFGPVEIT